MFKQAKAIPRLSICSLVTDRGESKPERPGTPFR